MFARLFASILAVGLASAARADTATLDGASIHYTDTGQGEPVVILIHGWACDGSFWDVQAASLSADHRVLVIDLPGHGTSDAPDIDYTQP